MQGLATESSRLQSESELNRAITRLANMTEALGVQFNRLNERIAPILRDTSDKALAQSGVPKPTASSSPIAIELNRNISELEILSFRFEELSSRLDI